MRPSHTRSLVAACVAVLVVCADLSGSRRQQQQTQPPPPGQVFRGGTDAVLVDVYPHRNGRIVEGLTAVDFEVLEDGRPQRIDSFEFVRLEGGATGEPRRDPNSVPEMRAMAADPHNRVFVVFLDNGHTTLEGGNRIRQPLVNMLERAVGPTDLFGVMTPGMRPVDLALGRKTSSIDDQLGRYWTWGTRQRSTTDNADPVEEQLASCFHVRHKVESYGAEDWYVKDGAVERFLDHILIERRREDRTLTSLEDLVNYLGQLREARSVVVAVTDGWLALRQSTTLTSEPVRDRRFARMAPRPRQRETPQIDTDADAEFAECVQELNRLASHDGAQRVRNLIALANRNNVSIYPVASGGLNAFDTGPNERPRQNRSSDPSDTILGRDLTRQSDRIQNLRTVAENTDGLAIVNTNDLGSGLRRIADDVSAYYLLTYASTNSRPDPRFRRIEVRVKGPDLSVRARRGYFAAREGVVATAPAGPVIPAGVAEALAGLTRSRAAAGLAAHGTVAGSQLRIAVELMNTPTGRWPEGTTVTASLARAGVTPVTATALLDIAWRNALLSLPRPAGNGPWQVTITVGTGPDRLQEHVSVAPTAGTLLGDAMLSRARPVARAPLRPAATFQFSRSERAHVEWPLLAPIDRREARLLDSRGQPLNVPIIVSDVTTPTPAVAADLNLGALANGDYVIEMRASAGETTVVRHAAIRVGQ